MAQQTAEVAVRSRGKSGRRRARISVWPNSTCPNPEGYARAMVKEDERFYNGDDHPFGGPPTILAKDATTVYPPVLSKEISDTYGGRWVLLRRGRVIADADDLDPLLDLPEREPGDTTAFVRSPDEAYI